VAGNAHAAPHIASQLLDVILVASINNASKKSLTPNFKVAIYQKHGIMVTHKRRTTMKKVTKVLIHWSENSEMNRMYNAKNGDINKEVTLNDFTLKCKAASLSAPVQGECYDKTKFTAYFTDGDVATFRLDMTQNQYNPKEDIQKYLDYKNRRG
jgi:Large polyvalent protein associated domain 25